MKTLKPLLFLTGDAPKLPIPTCQAARVLMAHFGHVQASYLSLLGQTFSLEPCSVFRGCQTQAYYVSKGAQFSVYKEMDEEGFIDLGDTETMFYCQVWALADDIGQVGYVDSRWWYLNRTPYAGRMMDGPSVIKDLLGMPKTGTPWNKFGSWSLQAKGRMQHEIAHHRVGENIRWWDYPDSQFTEEQKTTLKASPFFWVR